MDKDTFFAMTPKERVPKVNKLLEEYDMKWKGYTKLDSFVKVG